ncbi:20619_t:CDS:2, partial [Gigaspora rosea]
MSKQRRTKGPKKFSLEIANPHIDMKDLSSVLELYGKFSQLGIGALGLDSVGFSTYQLDSLIIIKSL